MKKASSLLLALVILLSMSPAAFALVEQSESFYAADYANVLSNSTEEWIVSANGLLEAQCQGAQIVVVTVDYLGGMYADEYAYELFNDWGVGSADYNNGMLLLLTTQEGKAWLAYGLGLTSSLSEEDVDALLEETFWDAFDRGEYDAAVSSLFTALLRWYDGLYGSSVAGQSSGQALSSPASAGPETGGSFLTGLVTVLILLLLLLLVARLLFRRPFSRGLGVGWLLGRSWRRRRPPPPPPPPGGMGGPFFRGSAPPPMGRSVRSRPPMGGPGPGGFGGARPARPASRPSSPPRGGVGGAGRGGRPGGFSGGSRPSGRGGGGFSGGGGGRR